MVVLDVTTAPPRKVDSLSPYVARCLDNADICGWNCHCGAVGATIGGEPPQCQDALWRAGNAPHRRAAVARTGHFGGSPRVDDPVPPNGQASAAVSI